MRCGWIERCAERDHVAGFEGVQARRLGHDLTDGVGELTSVAGVDHGIVHPRGDGEARADVALGEVRVDPRAAGPECVDRLRPQDVALLAKERQVGDVVEAGVPEHRREGLVGRGPSEAAAHDHGQFGLDRDHVADLGRHDDLVSGCDDDRGQLGRELRLNSAGLFA